ncbi:MULTISPECIES: LysE family translocator [Mesorhizobium]|jgi:homoserine/homoserine lactone efflux protein|uniref:Threonine/homoserine/homoserine lactone efflux protein n=1 Tax=Rhizobium loti TaxID=381 RepID=A0A8E2WEW6_RHILI|nr:MULTISPECIES: LysE family translocator [Mesorhizobium]PWJ92835.1 threonine/homoserine/homoserine lactone efflux protein [Mesorhizobium loti]RUX97047.1 LysE family translocator [Mesorhizobium sp. M7D.F.Ca.US.004.01.2.1]RVA23833.1 LysE family translocator [Mesorhizobium sp. M7D.F.Ca.US.004.03.1.1]
MENLPLVTFAFISVLGMAVPGPDVVLAITNGSRYGIRHAFFGMAGVVLSDIVLICMVALGFGALLVASEFYLSAVRMVGAFYLLFIAIGALRSSTGSRHAFDPGFPDKAHSTKALMVRCFVVAVTNPEAWLFFPAVLPPFVDSNEPIAMQYAVLAIIIAAADVFVLMLYATLGSRAARLLAGPNAVWIDRLYGIALLGLSSVLILQSLGHL